MAWIGKAVGLTLAGFLAVGTVQAVLATPDTPATAQTAPSTSHTAYCAAHAPRAGHWPRAREIGASRLTWQYVTRDEARYFHISPCSVVIAGNGQSVILTPRGNVVAKS